MTTAGSTAGRVPASVPAAPSLIDAPDLMPPAGHYSHIAVHRGLAYISGQLPVTPEGGKLIQEPFAVQAEQVLRNVDACLAAAGSSRDRLVSVTVYVTDIGDWPTFDRLYAQWLGAHRPQRAVAGVKELHYGSAVEVHAIAALD
ncbi:RidA family protein [Streptomyces malaysiensis]|uniref:Endoribonuclease L-PSP n=1 Tax=Streptomyces malaysiensis TaxID=92644 RepID=A0A7X6B0P7_STRMQ|nr:RidA family protein [Streptomyces malaysiensis]NIY69338.1 endoribonuclease L-PSP [Streptomyces malaysiensis]